jgi:hypothetical protein
LAKMFRWKWKMQRCQSAFGRHWCTASTRLCYPT